MVVVDKESLEKVINYNLKEGIKDAFSDKEVCDAFMEVTGKELRDTNQLFELAKVHILKMDEETHHIAFSLLRLYHRI